MNTIFYYDECRDTRGDWENGQGCQECCEHEFDPGEGYMCLNCGKEGFEDVMSRAFNDYKDSLYG